MQFLSDLYDVYLKTNQASTFLLFLEYLRQYSLQFVEKGRIIKFIVVYFKCMNGVSPPLGIDFSVKKCQITVSLSQKDFLRG